MTLTDRQTRLVVASEAVDAAARSLDIDFPATDLADPMIGKTRRELVQSRRRDVESLNLASKTVMAVANDPDAYAVMMELRRLSPELFTAVVNIGRQELDRLKASLATGKAA
jgi:hypothetical protein